VRIAICDVYYLEAIEALYAAQPLLRDAPYDQQHAAIMGLSLGTGDAYSAALRARGHEAQELVTNVDWIQAAWARERGVQRAALTAFGASRGLPRRLARQILLHAVVREQIETAKPDVVLVQDLSFFSKRELRSLRGPGRLLVGQLGIDPPADGRITELDLVVSSLPRQVARLRDLGLAAEYFAIGFDERVLARLEAEGVSTAADAERDIPLAFIGGITADVHAPGTATLEHLAAELDVQFWGYISGELRPQSPIRGRHHGPAWGLDMYRLLARTRVAVNRHSRVAEGMANNMRLFEATGVGACLLTEVAPNLESLFRPGSEVATYDSPENLVRIAGALLDDDAGSRAIAARGQQRTLAEHTYRQRMAELEVILHRHAGGS